ncbi:MAG: hypothetical protein R3F13_16920 [Prosthecobacter sp.]
MNNNIQTQMAETVVVQPPLRPKPDALTVGTLANATQMKPAVRRFSRRAFIPASLLCVGGIFLAHRQFTTTAARAELERRQRTALQALQKQARQGVEKADKADVAAMRQHRSVLVEKLTKAHASGLSAIPAASEQLGGFWNCAGMIARLAQDLVQGGNSASQHLASCLPAMMSSATQMQGAAQAALGSLHHEALGRTHVLCAELLQSARELPVGVPDMSVMQPLTGMMDSVQQQQLELGAAAVLLPVDILWTAAATRELFAGLLMPYARRAAAMLGTNVALIAADGPLPFGDVVALLGDIGFGLWTAWDIYWLSRNLPGEIAKTLRQGIDNMRDQALAAFDEASARMLKTLKSQRQQAVQPALALDPNMPLPTRTTI